MVPEKPSCSAADLEDSYLRLRKQDENCTAEEDTFVFDHDGVIHHKCSKMMVCPEGEKKLITYWIHRFKAGTCAVSVEWLVSHSTAVFFIPGSDIERHWSISCECNYFV